MANLKIGIVEDELVIARTITGTLEELGYEYCGPAINYTEALEMVESEKPDLLLLDIQLAGRKDGVDIGEKLNETHQLPFIFLTANSDIETIDRAKRVNPHAYIVKPFTKEELYAAIEIAVNNFRKQDNKPGVAKPAARNGKEFMFVKDGYVFRKVYFEELIYIESEANYVVLYLSTNKKVTVRSGINDFLEQLDSQRFLRIHRRYVVNTHLIADIFPTELILSDVKLPIGKSYRDKLLRALGIE